MQCTNNLKQLGLAVHTHADANQGYLPAGARDWNFLTWVYFVLPYIEQQSRYNQMSIQYHGPYGAPAGGGVGGSDWTFDANDPSEGGRYDRQQNIRPMTNEISAYTCPSSAKNEFIVNSNKWQKINYVACGGQTAIGSNINVNGWVDDYWALQGQGGDASDTLKQFGALFGITLLPANSGGKPAEQHRSDSINSPRFGQLNLSVASDGLSNTLLYSEMISAEGMGNNGASTSMSDFRGGVYRGDNAFFTAYYEPNTHRADEMMSANYCNNIARFQPCLADTSNRGYREIRLSARSKHTGGVNAGLGDGSVTFVSDTINRTIWRAAATARGGESKSL